MAFKRSIGYTPPQQAGEQASSVALHFLHAKDANTVTVAGDIFWQNETQKNHYAWSGDCKHRKDQKDRIRSLLKEANPYWREPVGQAEITQGPSATSDPSTTASAASVLQSAPSSNKSVATPAIPSASTKKQAVAQAKHKRVLNSRSDNGQAPPPGNPLKANRTQHDQTAPAAAKRNRQATNIQATNNQENIVTYSDQEKDQESSLAPSISYGTRSKTRRNTGSRYNALRNE
ncbi:MAG: hypothetical protein Q9181_007039 [Wetmoreana brouardii]